MLVLTKFGHFMFNLSEMIHHPDDPLVLEKYCDDNFINKYGVSGL